MLISENEILFIYNSKDLQDRQALQYARSLPNHRIKEVDIQKESFTETQVKQIADILEVDPVSLINSNSHLYQKDLLNTQLRTEGALRVIASEPQLIKTPIAIYSDHAENIKSPFQLIKQDLDEMPSINCFYELGSQVNVQHDDSHQRFKAQLGTQQMTLEYTSVSSDLIDFTSTQVPLKYRNRGLGSKLVKTGLVYANENDLKVKASCPFVLEVIKRNPKFGHLLVG